MKQKMNRDEVGLALKKFQKQMLKIAHSSTEREGILANRVTTLQFHSFIHSFIRLYFLDAFYILDATLGAEDSAVNRQWPPLSKSLYLADISIQREF